MLNQTLFGYWSLWFKFSKTKNNPIYLCRKIPTISKREVKGNFGKVPNQFVTLYSKS